MQYDGGKRYVIKKQSLQTEHKLEKRSLTVYPLSGITAQSRTISNNSETQNFDYTPLERCKQKKLQGNIKLYSLVL